MKTYFYDDNGKEEFFIDLYSEKKWIMLLGLFKSNIGSFNAYRINKSSKMTYREIEGTIPKGLYFFGMFGLVIDDINDYIKKLYLPVVISYIIVVLIIFLSIYLTKKYEMYRRNKMEEYIKSRKYEEVRIIVEIKNRKLITSILLNLFLIAIVVSSFFGVIYTAYTINDNLFNLILCVIVFVSISYVYYGIFSNRKLSDFIIIEQAT